MEVRDIQGAIGFAVLVFLILCTVIRPLRERLFGPPETDDSKGFPRSRKSAGNRRHYSANSRRWRL